MVPAVPKYEYQIAGVSIVLETDRVLATEDIFRPFITKNCKEDFRAVFRQVDRLPMIEDTVLWEDRCYRVHSDGKDGYLRSFFDAPRDLTAYAVATYDDTYHLINVEYLEKGARCVSEMRNSFFHLGLETLLLRRERVCLHAACVETAVGGILFSGPSGIGKTTQAELWCRYRGARLINGDLPILEKTQTGWRAWSSPFAGSSQCHLNECCGVTAIVKLRQASENRLRRLDQAEAFRAVWSGLTVNRWSRWCSEKACDLAVELVQQIPVYELSCTADLRAVEVLEQGL